MPRTDTWASVGPLGPGKQSCPPWPIRTCYVLGVAQSETYYKISCTSIWRAINIKRSYVVIIAVIRETGWEGRNWDRKADCGCYPCTRNARVLSPGAERGVGKGPPCNPHTTAILLLLSSGRLPITFFAAAATATDAAAPRRQLLFCRPILCWWKVEGFFYTGVDFALDIYTWQLIMHYV